MDDLLSSPEALEAVSKAYRASAIQFTPPPRVTVSQWADTFRRLSTEDSAEAGRWDTAVAEYQRAPMDAFTDPTVSDIVLKCAAQVGKSAIILNCMGYVVACAPVPMLCVLPTKDDAEEFSKDRFSSALVQPTEVLRGKVHDVKSGAGKDKSTIQHKRYPGGQLTFAWANSPSRLSSRPIAKVFGDEVDKWRPHPVQGDPMERAKKRTATYRATRKHVWASTPTIKGDEGEEGSSLIDRMYNQSSRGKFHVPCPHCKTFGVLGFFPDSQGVEQTTGFHVEWPREEKKHEPLLAFAVCHACGAVVEPRQKYEMVRSGHWVHEDPTNPTRGFHISATISPWSTWGEMADRFLKAGHNSEKLRTFWNEELGESWEMRGEMISDSFLISRKEQYAAACPMNVAVLTAGVDVQKDRLEVKVKGWGIGQERWDVDYQILRGDPDGAEVWAELDSLLDQHYEHETGQYLGIVCTLVDAGYKTKRVYEFCKTRWGQHIFPCIGRPNGPGLIRPGITTRPTKLANGCSLYTVGVDTLKEHIYRCLRVDRPGPGYCHFPADARWDDEYFAQLVAEKIVVRTKGYRQTKVWEKTRERNEALDLEVYAEAALEVRKVDLTMAHANLLAAAKKAAIPPRIDIIPGALQPEIRPEQPQTSVPQRRIVRNNWVNRW
jgi:phage terminase large subunit GpA-like protein